MLRRATVALCTLALALAACGQEVLVSPPGSVSLAGTRWVVAALTVDGSGGALPAAARLTLDFDQAGGVGGTAGCNSYFGTAAITGGRIAITGIGATEMACEPEIMEREARFFDALGRVSSFALDADRLTLSAPDGTVSIELTAFVPEPDRPLAGTVWHLTTLIDGEAASSVIAGTDPTLEVDQAAGSISGNSGCNSFFGPATFAEGTVSVGAIGTTRMACDPGIMEQEAFILAVLEGATSWEIDGISLVLTAADGRALGFTAG